MKKVFLMEFDYEEDAKGIAESFDTTPEELVDIILKTAKLASEGLITKRTEGLMRLIESGEITGGQILTLATMALADAHKEAIMSFLGESVEGEI